MLERLKTFVRLGVLCLVLALGALAGGCGGGGTGDQGNAEQAKDEPAKETPAQGPEQTAGRTTGAGAGAEAGGTTAAPVGAGDAVVRVSGDRGVAYSGTFGTAREVRTVNTTTLEEEFTDYEVAVQGEDGALNATFKKTQPGREVLAAEILVGGEPVTSSQTSAELGSVTVTYVPPEAQPEELTLPDEFEGDGSP